MKFGRIARWAAVVATTLLALGQSAWAQGCVMCYTSASALGGGGSKALDKAIIVLWIPPALIFFGIFALIYRRRKVWRNSDTPGEHLLDLETGAVLPHNG
jgi:Na+/proline symporter